MKEQPATPAVSAQKRSRLVVRVFGVVGAVAEGPAAIAGLVLVVLILSALLL